jgi:hypothetical protein
MMSLVNFITQLFDPAPPAPPAPPQPKPNRRNGRVPRPNQRRHGGHRHQSSHKSVIAYHGTPSEANAADILRNGFAIGAGNGFTDGVYFSTALTEAKGYARSNGVYLKCRIDLGRCAVWNAQMDQRFRDWCSAQNAPPTNSSKTAFLLKQRFQTLQAGQEVVVLWPQHKEVFAWKRKFWNVKILSVHRAGDDARIRV